LDQGLFTAWRNALLRLAAMAMIASRKAFSIGLHPLENRGRLA
jgi:hypothetical protein